MVTSLVAIAAMLSSAAAELSPSLGGTTYRAQITPLMNATGSAGSPVEIRMHTPAQLLPGIGPLRADESEKQAASLPPAASRMVKRTYFVLTS